MNRTCQDCGDPYEGGKAARFCPACRKEHARTAIRARRARRKAEGKGDFHVGSRRERMHESDGYVPPDSLV